MAEESFGDRTEKATPRKREEARKKGQIARSREISSVMILMAGMSILFFFGTSICLQFSNLMVQFLKRMETHSLDPTSVIFLSRDLMWSFFLILAPLLAGVTLVAVMGNFIQGGSVFSVEMLKFDVSRLDLTKGLSRIISKQSAVELLKSLFKILIVGWVAYSTIKKEWPQILCLLGQDVGIIFKYVGAISFRLLLRTGLVMMVLAALDYFFQRWTFEKNLKMSKQEIKDEMKQTEGDPLIKSRIRSIQRQMARRRMMAEVPKADVIITNPTHLAVALYYQSKKMEAPQVIAKGAGWIAEKIIEIGKSHQIPVVENKPLAQILYKTVDLGKTIPSTLYQAVADILAYVYKIKNKKL